MRIHTGWCSVSGATQHCGPEQGMKIHDVLADEVIHLGIAASFPVVVKVQAIVAVAKILEARHVSNRRIQPYIKVLVFSPRNPKSEVWFVTRYIPISQAGVEPLVEFRNDALMQCSAADPFAQSLFVIAEFEEVMFGLTLDRLGTGQYRHRIDQVLWRVGSAAYFTGIAVLILACAARASAANKSIRKKYAFLLVVGLFDRTCVNIAAFAQRFVDSTDQCFVFGGMGRVVVIEVDAEVREVLHEFSGYFFGQFFR